MKGVLEVTHATFEELFHRKYPDGETWKHEPEVSGRIQKTAVIFVPGGKVYFFTGAYEDVLCKIGINVISKERYESKVATLEWMKSQHGTEDFFGGVVDNTAEIERMTSEIENYTKNYVIV